MRTMTLVLVLFVCGSFSGCSDGGGGGGISRYCNALCDYYEECNEFYYEDEWDQPTECVADCREDTIQDWAGDECFSPWLSYQTCYYEVYTDDCFADDVWDTCEDQWERLEDCWDDQNYDQTGGPEG